ncbi:hypothetical protein [Natrialbaceae archaeon AArc-T1-2]|uniref:hypothetical protein n=1 Tax=Natrialbaceae archaeon AArc-T1-2 TaxID=3053904 RepID=UPI00255B01BE|nr:hypothetical protein [Natrialbaceae archaeon AArc-T1-2]WIV66743.1 hypothetical protein QQ977_13735 [Natrialbaceae archaeon AArc-T1-2]
MNVLSALLTALVFAPAYAPDWVTQTPGLWLIFGIIFVPVYIFIGSWFLGKPGNFKTAMLGFVVFIGLIVLLWTGMFLQTMLIRFVFF